MKYDIKCDECGKILGFVERAESKGFVVKGYLCGSPNELGTCSWKESEKKAKKTKKKVGG